MREGCNDHGRRKSWNELWRAGGFGPDGPFGREGPFGPTGPFGPSGPFGPGGPFGTGGRGARRRGRMFGGGELRLVLLALIVAERRHGYELIKEIGELTRGAYEPSPGTVYPTLSLLEDEGMIRGITEDDTRKVYEATDAGRAEAEERDEEAAELMSRLSAHGERHKPFASPDLFRAVGNLAGVLKNRARAGKLDEKTIEDIVDLIDELAKKIERL